VNEKHKILLKYSHYHC